MVKRRPAATVAEALGLLSDPTFHAACDEAFITRTEAGFTQEDLYRFFDTWGVVPPWNEGLYRPEFRRQTGWTLRGRWGMVAIWPSTTDADMKAALRAIQRSIGKRHRDSLALELRKDTAAWLSRSGFQHAEIAAGLYGRGKDAKRPTLAAVKRKRLTAADRLVAQSMATGIPHALAERRAWITLRGAEGKGAQAARAETARADREHQRMRAEMRTPVEVNGLTGAVRTLLGLGLWSSPPRAPMRRCGRCGSTC